MLMIMAYGKYLVIVDDDTDDNVDDDYDDSIIK